VTLASNATAYAAYTGTAVVSDLALDALTTGFLYAYSAWEDQGTGTGNYTVQGNLTALDPTTGATQWTLNLPLVSLPSGWAPLESDCGNAAPAVADDGTVYVGHGDGLRAVNGATGTVNWTFASANVSSSPAIGGDGTVFFGTDDGSFYAVYPNGTLRFKVTSGGPISASPAISGDGTAVYFTSDDGNLYAVH
jgi:outer membrane protein assembly factor BamB